MSLRKKSGGVHRGGGPDERILESGERGFLIFRNEEGGAWENHLNAELGERENHGGGMGEMYSPRGTSTTGRYVIIVDPSWRSIPFWKHERGRYAKGKGARGGSRYLFPKTGSDLGTRGVATWNSNRRSTLVQGDRLGTRSGESSCVGCGESARVYLK